VFVKRSKYKDLLRGESETKQEREIEQEGKREGKRGREDLVINILSQAPTRLAQHDARCGIRERLLAHLSCVGGGGGGGEG